MSKADIVGLVRMRLKRLKGEWRDMSLLMQRADMDGLRGMDGVDGANLVRQLRTVADDIEKLLPEDMKEKDAA